MEGKINNNHKGNVIAIMLLLSFSFILCYSDKSFSKEYEEVLEIYVGQTEILSHQGVSSERAPIEHVLYVAVSRTDAGAGSSRGREPLVAPLECDLRPRAGRR